MPEIPLVIGGDTATADWANTVAARTAQRYATAAARDASLPGAVAGELAWLEDSETLTVKVFGGWATVASGGAAVQERFIAPGVILDQESFFLGATASGVSLDFVVIPGSSLTGIATVEVIGTVGFATLSGAAGFNIIGTNVTGNIGNQVTLPAGEVAVAWRRAEVPLGASNNTITVQSNATVADASYTGQIRAWMN